jgi:hypothetical protein
MVALPPIVILEVSQVEGNKLLSKTELDHILKSKQWEMFRLSSMSRAFISCHVVDHFRARIVFQFYQTSIQTVFMAIYFQ